jgi:GNAT superfamily N-acetyltransferase
MVAPDQTFKVRRATLADAAGILKCLGEAFEPYREAYTADAFADTVLTPATLKERLSRMSIFAATSGNEEIIGTIACSRVKESEGHIRGMAVRSAWQGSGIARRLLEAAEAELRALGCRRITLDTTQPLQRAISFYHKNGFVPSGRVSEFFGMPLYEYVKEPSASS